MARRRARRRAAADRAVEIRPASRPRPARSTPLTLAQSLGALIPENAIVVDEGVSTGRGFFPVDAQRASAHLAAEHGRLDRHRHAAGDRRGGRVPGPQGAEHPGRRLRDVHDPGAVDAGAREPRTSPRCCSTTSSYAILRHGACERRRAECRPQGARHARPLAPRSRLRACLRAAWACRASASTTMDEFNAAVARGLAVKGPYLVEVMLV